LKDSATKTANKMAELENLSNQAFLNLQSVMFQKTQLDDQASVANATRQMEEMKKLVGELNKQIVDYRAAVNRLSAEDQEIERKRL
jgi:hypothetical protein